MMRFFLLTTVLIVVTSYSTVSSSSLAKFSKRLSDQIAKGEQNFDALIILKNQADLQYRDDTDLTKGQYVFNELVETAKSQDSLVARLDEDEIRNQAFYVANIVAIFAATPKQLQEIADRDDVLKIVSNAESKTLPPVDKSEIPPSKGMAAIEESIVSIGADKVWSEFGVNGEGIVIAGQDTGIDWDHQGLIKSYRGWDGENANHDLNWHDSIRESISVKENKCGLNTEEPCDDNGHGTHTLGTMVGSEGDTNQVGVAPGAKWVGCRNMDEGVGRLSTYVECFEWFLAPYPRNGNPRIDGNPDLAPHIINNSWGCPTSEGCYGEEMILVLEAMKAAGIMVVVSAGNDGPGCSTIQSPPAMHTEQTLSVGAHNHRDGKIAGFSSRGPSAFDGGIGPYVTAPGVNIRSTTPGGKYAGYFWSGTSMAGPHVAGLIALLWSADSSLIGDIDKTLEVVRTTATPTAADGQSCGDVAADANPNNTFGYGQINAYEAVASRLGETN